MALRELPAAQIAQIQSNLIASRFKGYDPNASIVDGWVLPQSTARAFALGKIQPVDLLAGLERERVQRISSRCGGRREEIAAAREQTERDRTDETIRGCGPPALWRLDGHRRCHLLLQILFHGAPAIDQASNDIVAACPIGAEAALTTIPAGALSFTGLIVRCQVKARQNSGPSIRWNSLMSSGHFRYAPLAGCHLLPTDQKLSQIVQSYWTNFAKTGDPNGPGLAHWVSMEHRIRNRIFLLVTAAMQSHSNIFPRCTAIFRQIV